MLRANVVDEQSAVPLVQVAQQLGATLVALVHDVCARFEDDRREELRVRLAKVPDTVDATVRPDSRRIHESARDDHAGVCHGRNVPRYPNVPLAAGIWEEDQRQMLIENNHRNPPHWYKITAYMVLGVEYALRIRPLYSFYIQTRKNLEEFITINDQQQW